MDATLAHRVRRSVYSPEAATMLLPPKTDTDARVNAHPTDQTGPSACGEPAAEVLDPIERQQWEVDAARQLAEALERKYIRMGQPACVCSADLSPRCIRCQRDLARHQWGEANLALAKLLSGTPPGEKTEAESIAESVRGVRARPYCERLWGDE